MKIIYNIPNIIRRAGMERILAIKANYLAGLTGMEVVIITYEQKNLPLAFDFSDKIRFYDLDIDYAACRGKNIFLLPSFNRYNHSRSRPVIMEIVISGFSFNNISSNRL